MKRLLLITTCLLTAVPAFAQSASMQSPAYQECTTLANTNPTQALAKADAWLKIDTSIASQHCRAMALYGLRRYPEAADTLNTVRNAIGPANIALRSYITRQASRAYINASQADKALSLLTSQINEIGNTKGDNANASRLTSDLLLDRARLNATYGKLEESAKDLDHAVSLTPVNTEVLLERAGIFEKLGDIPLAKNDVDAVLVINSGNSQARAMRDRLTGTSATVAIPSTVVTQPAPATTTLVAPVAPAANPQETSTLVAPTPLLNSSTSAAPSETADEPVAPAPVKRKKYKKKATPKPAPATTSATAPSVKLPLPDAQAP